MTTDTAPHLVAERLFRDEIHSVVGELAGLGRHLVIAASSLVAARHLQTEFQWCSALPTTARFRWANSEQRIELDDGGEIVFTSTTSSRIHGLTCDAVLLDYRASDEYRAMAVVSMATSHEPRLFEVDL
jgi:hypothetical protein